MLSLGIIWFHDLQRLSFTLVFQRELGHILVSLGMTSAALDTYLVLEMWEDVIKCYKTLGRREKVGRVTGPGMAAVDSQVLDFFYS